MFTLLSIFALVVNLLLIPVSVVVSIFYTALGYTTLWSYEGAHGFAQRISEQELDPYKCLDIKYTHFQFYIFGQGLSDNILQNTCLEDIAEKLKDPMICTKMHGHYSAASCLYDA